METINEKNIEVASELVGKGFLRAAVSFTNLVKQKVEIDTKKVVSAISTGDEIPHLNGTDTIILTDIIGELSGQSYLVFNKNERVGICKKCLAAFGMDSNTELHDEVILKEIDNILSAAVISEFSNALGLKIFGDVPKIVSMIDLPKPEATSDLVFMSNAHFIFEDDVEFNPKFFWRLDGKFIQLVNKLSD